MQRFPAIARYSLAVNTARALIEDSVTDFPVDPFQICAWNGWKVTSYSYLAQQEGVTISEIAEALHSDEGTSCRKNGRYYIFYNDVRKSYERIRFTVTHEIGHICLGHLELKETRHHGELSEEQYKILENEANAFARNVLAPASYVNKLRWYFNTDSVSSYFRISRPAAKARMDFLDIDLMYLA